MVSEPTSRDCQQGVQLVLLIQNLHPGDCLLSVHSTPISRGLSAGEYILFTRLRTYFQGSKSEVQSDYKLGF